MPSFAGDEDDREDSADASSDGDQEEQMDGIDDVDADGSEVDGEGNGEQDDENEENEDDLDEQEESQDSFGEPHIHGHNRATVTSYPSSMNGTAHPHEELNRDQNSFNATGSSDTNPALRLTTPSPRESPLLPFVEYPKIRPEVLTALIYDIVPTIAAPHNTSINVVTATPDLRWVFSGGTDGYIRKFNWVETANGKAMLTVAQKHPFVDSVTKAGVLMSYWENEEADSKNSGNDSRQSLSAVYALAVQSQGLWLLSGLESGGINLQSVRHDEGKRITCLRKHTSAVSVLHLAPDERSLLSGSWDKSVVDWDLDTGQVKRTFEGSGGQISALEIRPISSLPVPEASGEVVLTNGTFSSNNWKKPAAGSEMANGVHRNENSEALSTDDIGMNDAGSPADSLFGGGDADSLFGDNDDGDASRNFANDEDDDFSRAIANGIREQEVKNAEGDVNMDPGGEDREAPVANGGLELCNVLELTESSGVTITAETNTSSITNGLPHAENDSSQHASGVGSAQNLIDTSPVAESIFLAASFDGTLRIWDKRKPTPVAKISPRNVPPWCMNACWSPDGNFIYAGRRNGAVEEFSLHKGLQGAERTFKFPSDSGAVSAVRAMPNGRHLICASYDILRLYDLQQQQIFKHSTVPFLIIPGHRTGVISQMYIDPSCRYMISVGGNRGWQGSTTEVLLGYEIGVGTT